MTSPDVLAEFSAATLFESGASGPLDGAVRPLDDSWKVAGRAFTVELAPGHNIWVHRAVYRASPGDVLVVSCGGGYDYGYWGDILTTAAKAVGLAGLVIDGCIRDAAEIKAVGFPVFARGLCVRGTGKDASIGGMGTSSHVAGVLVRTGDIVVGDVDGIVVVPADVVDDVAAKARSRVAAEETILTRLAAGETTLEVYGFA